MVNKIKMSWDIDIEFADFWITKEIIDEVINIENIEGEWKEKENRVIIWLIIWKIREAFLQNFLASREIKKENINEIIEILKLALPEIWNSYNTFEELGLHIFKDYNFKDIKNSFLNNETNIDIFLNWVKKFLDNINNELGKTDKIIKMSK